MPYEERPFVNTEHVISFHSFLNLYKRQKGDSGRLLNSKHSATEYISTPEIDSGPYLTLTKDR